MGQIFYAPVREVQIKAREDKQRTLDQDLIAAYLLEQLQAAENRALDQDLINAYLLEQLNKEVTNDV